MMSSRGDVRRALAGLGVVLLLLAPAAAQDGAQRPSFSLPSFLGVDGVKALEEAQNAIQREADAQRAREAEAKAERRRAAEQEAKRHAEEVRRQIATEGAKKSASPPAAPVEVRTTSVTVIPLPKPKEVPAVASPPQPPASANASVSARAAALALTIGEAGRAKPCGSANVNAAPMAGGRVRIAVQSPCRKSEAFQITYGDFVFERMLDAAGGASLVFDLFLGKTESLLLTFADKTQQDVAIEALDLDRVSKVAVLWSAPVDLDLHAFAHAAARGEADHVWSGAASTVEVAMREATESGRGHGFLSHTDDGKGSGLKAEVYTFIHGEAEPQGTVAMALDYASRGAVPSGDWCGAGQLASVEYEVVVLTREGKVTRENGVIAGAKCGMPLAEAARFNRSAVPDLRIRK